MAVAQCTSSCSMQLVLLRLPSEILLDDGGGVGKLPGHGRAPPTSRNRPNPSPLWPLLGWRGGGGGGGAVGVNCIMWGAEGEGYKPARLQQ
jgi:hypothetical protein